MSFTFDTKPFSLPTNFVRFVNLWKSKEVTLTLTLIEHVSKSNFVTPGNY